MILLRNTVFALHVHFWGANPDSSRAVLGVPPWISMCLYTSLVFSLLQGPLLPINPPFLLLYSPSVRAGVCSNENCHWYVRGFYLLFSWWICEIGNMPCGIQGIESLVNILFFFLSKNLCHGFLLTCWFPAKFSWFALCVCSVLPVGFSPPVIRLISFTWPSLTCPQLYLINKCLPVFSFFQFLVSCWVLSHSLVSQNHFVCRKVWILGFSVLFFDWSASILFFDTLLQEVLKNQYSFSISIFWPNTQWHEKQWERGIVKEDGSG